MLISIRGFKEPRAVYPDNREDVKSKSDPGTLKKLVATYFEKWPHVKQIRVYGRPNYELLLSLRRAS